MNRPRTSAFVGISLDGFLARPDGRIDWLTPFEGTENGYTAFIETVDALVIGRRTYDFVQTIPWPYGKRACVVMTHRPVAGTNGERASTANPAALLAELQRDGIRHAYIDGGEVIRGFLSAGLLDALTVTVVPALIGEGRPLFGGVQLETGLRLEETRPLEKGMVQLRYALPARG